MIIFRTYFLRFFVPMVLAALGLILATMLLPSEWQAVNQQLIGFPDSDAAAHKARPAIMAALCFLPSIAALLYAISGTLDRYIVRQFAGIFLICLTGLLMIWLLVDLGDKIPEFRQSDGVFETIVKFYASRSPAVLSLMIPYSILLAALYSLGKLSASREIIAMIQTGRGILRITMPLIISGLLFSLLCLGLNYHWAPTAEGNVDIMLAESAGKPADEAKNVLYPNLEARRLWLVGAFPKNYQLGKPLLDIEITTTRADKTIFSRLSAKSATWDRITRDWTFVEPVLGNFQPNQPAIFQTENKTLIIPGWSETPWQLIKPGLSAEFLGIPDLNSWLNANSKNFQFADPAPYQTQWHYRWALPFGCLITILLAIPLGIHFSRHGAGNGVFIAVTLAGLMLLTTSISTALGASGTLPPAWAAWAPTGVFVSIACFLLHRRVSGQPLFLVIHRLISKSTSSI